MEELVTWAIQLGDSVARVTLDGLKILAGEPIGFLSGFIAATVIALAIAKDFTINRQVARGALWALGSLGALVNGGGAGGNLCGLMA